MSYSDPNTWPRLRLAPDPGIANRPWWRYPSRSDFYVMTGGGIRIDYPSREIDWVAKRSDGDCITVSRKMTLLERVIFHPRIRRLPGMQVVEMWIRKRV